MITPVEEASPLQLQAAAAHRARMAKLWRLEPVVVRPKVAAVVLPFGAPVNLLTMPSWRTLLALVSAKHRIPIATILSHSRIRPVAMARHEAIRLVKDHCPHLSLPQIGRLFHRDHTTILYALYGKRERYHRWKPEEIERVRQMWAEGKSQQLCADVMRVSRNSIVRVIRRYKFPKRKTLERVKA